MAKIRTNIDKTIEINETNTLLIHAYIDRFLTKGNHRIYRGNYANFQLMDLLPMLGFTVALDVSNHRCVIKSLTSYDNETNELLEMVSSLE